VRAFATFETNLACHILEGQLKIIRELTCLRTTASPPTALLFLKTEAIGELVARAWMVAGWNPTDKYIFELRGEDLKETVNIHCNGQKVCASFNWVIFVCDLKSERQKIEK
jgi:hypothetical protein